MSTFEPLGRTVRVFLTDGRPYGLRRATLHGWTGVTYVCGQSSLGDLVARAEVDRPGIYVLAGPDLERPDATRVYIGSGSSVAEEIDRSAREHEVWETAITFTMGDHEMLDRHAAYLAERLITDIARAGQMTLSQPTQPGPDHACLTEADIANMENVLEHLRIVLPLIGLHI